MAGVKGRSGGARPNAGRKKDPQKAAEAAKPPVTCPDGVDMLEFLQQVARGLIDAKPTQVRAAIAAVQYTHVKKGDTGKKEERQKAAEGAASKFAPAPPPLAVIRGGKSP